MVALRVWRVLLFTGVKMALPGHDEQDIGKRPLVRWLYYHLRVTNELHGERFFIRRKGLLFATPLLLALIMVEFSDVIFPWTAYRRFSPSRPIRLSC